MPRFSWLLVLFLSSCATTTSAPITGTARSIPTTAALDAEVARAMAVTHARGLAIAIIDAGKVVQVRSYGQRNVAGDPLQVDTIMYGASLTKAAFALTVMQLVDEHVLQLDQPIAGLLDKPLPAYPDEDRYAPWSGLADDPRWRQITPRILLTHSAGFANFAFLEPDQKLRIHTTPGTHYAYSGDGMILLQFVLERGLRLDLGREMQQRVFDRFGMARTSMQWRDDFTGNLADGWDVDDNVVEHDARSRVRAAGSMDTTITDMAQFAAGYVRGDGLTKQSRAELTSPQLPIRTLSQFPTLRPDQPTGSQRADLAAGLGVVVFDGPQGHGFYKGGHNDSTGNTLVCIERRQRCVVILSNDVRAEAAFPHLVAFAIGATGAPWTWEYGDMPMWDGAAGSVGPFAHGRTRVLASQSL